MAADGDAVTRAFIVVHRPPPPRPKFCPPHRWAWAQLTNGGTVQVCRICGTERR